MKKLLSIAVCASAVAAFATDTEVVCGSVGVTAITSSLTNTVVAVSFTDLASSGNITVSNIVKTANLEVDDILYVFNGNSYESYTLKASGGVKYWDKTVNYTLGTGGLSASEGTAASLATLAVGQGLWLVRGPNWNGSEFTFYIYGKPANETSVSVSAGSNLIGNPTASDVSPTVQGGATTGDQVLIPQNYKFPRTYTWNGTAWSYTDSNHLKKTQAQLPVIKAGTGFWYVAKGSATIKFN